MRTVTYRPFFAILPPPDLALHIHDLGAEHGLPGHRVEPERLHVTTFPFDSYPTLPEDIIAQAKTVASGLSLPAFHLVFDRLVGDDRGVRVLPSRKLTGFEPVAAALETALREAGLAPVAGWRFHPHMTLLYGRGPTLDVRLPGGIRWKADRLSLILSELGAHCHVTIAHWPLTA